MCPNIIVGAAHGNPTVLTRQDGRLYPGSREGWSTAEPMWWQIQVQHDATFDIRVNLPDDFRGDATLLVRWQNVEQSLAVTEATDHHTFRGVGLPAGCGRFDATLMQGDRRLCVMNVFVTSREHAVNTI